MQCISVLLVTTDDELFNLAVRRAPRDWHWERATIRDWSRRALAGALMIAFVDETSCGADAGRVFAEVELQGVPLPCVLRWRPPREPRGAAVLAAGSAFRLSDLESPCAPGIWAALVRSFCAAMRRCVSRDPAIRDALSEVFEAVLSANPPVRSVRELARRTKVARKRLRAAWDEGYGAAAHLTLPHFIEICLVLGAIERKSARVGWRSTLRKFIHIRERRLRTAARKHLGIELEELASGRLPEVLDLVADSVLTPLGADKSKLFPRQTADGRRQTAAVSVKVVVA